MFRSSWRTLIEFEGSDQSAVVARFRELLTLQENVDGLAGEGLAPAQVGDFKVGRDGLGQHADARRVVVRLRRQVLLPGSPRVVACASPEVQLVREVDTQRPGFDAEAFGELEAGQPVARDFAELLAEAGVGRVVRVADVRAGLDGGKQGGARDPRLGPGLLYPGHRLGQVEVGGQHRVDDGVERRVLEGGPPLPGLVRARLLALLEAVGKLGDRLRDRWRRRERARCKEEQR